MLFIFIFFNFSEVFFLNYTNFPGYVYNKDLFFVLFNLENLVTNINVPDVYNPTTSWILFFTEELIINLNELNLIIETKPVDSYTVEELKILHAIDVNLMLFESVWHFEQKNNWVFGQAWVFDSMYFNFKVNTSNASSKIRYILEYHNF